MSRRRLGWLVALFLSLCGFSGTAWAAQSSSPNYQIDEVFFGAGGALNACSPTYCSKQSLGETAVGNTASGHYQAQAGFNTNRGPYLQFTVNSSNQNLGTLSATATATATATFSVKSYLTHGYVVQTISPGPSNGSHTLASPGTPTTSAVGTEQFGINLVANTSPTSFGANVSQVPSSSFSFGVPASGYNTPNYYKYTQGDTIASSSVSSGESDFTISYIFNISNATPGGTYSLNQVLVATATF